MCTHLLFVASVAVAVGLVGCYPYERREGEYSMGPVDPLTFPAEYLGAGGNRMMSGKGVFNQVPAFVNGKRVGYFPFSFSPAQLPAAPAMPDLRILVGGMPQPKIPIPTAYVFDPSVGSPFPASPACAAPSNYVFDARNDEVRYDQQGNIFTALPTAKYDPGVASTTTYVPIVAEVTVTSSGEPCQSIKSSETLLKRSDVMVAPKPDDRYLAWAIIDPGAAVFQLGDDPNTATGVTFQKLGWFNHFLVTYLDGGYIPTVDSTDMMGRTVRTLQKQILYVPRSMVVSGGAMKVGAIGKGYDVLDAARGDAAYSPVCAVMTYDAGAPKTPAQLPRDAATIAAMYVTAMNPLQPAAVPFIYCLQAQ